MIDKIVLYFSWLVLSLVFISAVYLNPSANIFIYLQVALIVLFPPGLLLAVMIHEEQIRR
ncbi:hypothetical protein [Phascolarctobacterium succinatutens]|uniref:hypothetical protein n=1 Tax=Phascolarctobacterium succinatutens TaxID=626940 RepID=UPI00307E6F9D